MKTIVIILQKIRRTLWPETCCGNCRFYQEDPGTDLYGDCRHRAPVMWGDEQTGNKREATWPMTRPGEWCGQHQYIDPMTIRLLKKEA